MLFCFSSVIAPPKKTSCRIARHILIPIEVNYVIFSFFAEAMNAMQTRHVRRENKQKRFSDIKCCHCTLTDKNSNEHEKKSSCRREKPTKNYDYEMNVTFTSTELENIFIIFRHLRLFLGSKGRESNKSGQYNNLMKVKYLTAE